jgi:hypothetical protein
MNSANADGESSTFSPRMKPFRRKRVSQGEHWTPDRTSFETGPDKGLYCRECRRQKKWKDLSTTYEKQGTDLMRIWWCECDNMLRMDNMTDLQLHYELEGSSSDTAQ